MPRFTLKSLIIVLGILILDLLAILIVPAIIFTVLFSSMGESKLMGEFLTPAGDKKITIESFNPGASGGYRTIIYLMNKDGSSKSLISDERGGFGGTIYWVDSNRFCLVYEGGEVNTFKLGENCEGEFVDYFDI